MKLATPLLLCLVCVELSDVVFAFDSVPAVFGVTQDPFIVYTSNMCVIKSLNYIYLYDNKSEESHCHFCSYCSLQQI